MSGSTESAGREKDIQQRQRELDAIDNKVDNVIEGDRSLGNLTEDDVKKVTNTYIGRVNDVQGRVRQLRDKVTIKKDMRAGGWTNLEQVCNGVEQRLYEQLQAVDSKELTKGTDEFRKSIDEFLARLNESEKAMDAKETPETKPTAIETIFAEWLNVGKDDPKASPNPALCAKEALKHYNERTLRLLPARIALINKLDPSVAQQMLGIAPRIDTRQLALELAKGLLIHPSKSENFPPNSLLFVEPEKLVARAREALLDKAHDMQEQLKALQDNLKQRLDHLKKVAETKQGEQVVNAATASYVLQANEVKQFQQKIGAQYQAVLHFDMALCVFDATKAQNEGRLQEANRVYFKLQERYGADLQKIDPEIAAQAKKSIDALRAKRQLSQTELHMLNGDTTSALDFTIRSRNEFYQRDAYRQALYPGKKVPGEGKGYMGFDWRSRYPLPYMGPKFLGHPEGTRYVPLNHDLYRHVNVADMQEINGKRVFLTEDAKDKVYNTPENVVVALIRQPEDMVLTKINEGPPPVYQVKAQTLDASDFVYAKVEGRDFKKMGDAMEKGWAVLKKWGAEYIPMYSNTKGPHEERSEHVELYNGGLRLTYKFRYDTGQWYPQSVYRGGRQVEFDKENGVPFPNPENDAERKTNAIIDEMRGKGFHTPTGVKVWISRSSPNPLPENRRNGDNMFVEDGNQVDEMHNQYARDALRVLDQDKDVKAMVGTASTLQQSLGVVSQLYEAGMKGSRPERFVELVREQGNVIWNALNDVNVSNSILQARLQLERLKSMKGVLPSAIEKEITERMESLDQMVKLMNDPTLRQFAELARDKSTFDADTWGNWFKNNLPMIIAAIAIATLVVVTWGAATPLAVAAISATGGVIAHEVTNETMHAIKNATDADVLAGKATWRKRSFTGAYVEGVFNNGKIYDPSTGKYEDVSFIDHLASPLAKMWAQNFVMTLAMMGAGAAIGRGLTSFVNSQAGQALTRNVPMLQKLLQKIARINQNHSEATEKFFKKWGKETGDELVDELLENGAEALDDSLGKVAILIKIAAKNFKPKGYTSVRGKGGTDLGVFEYPVSKKVGAKAAAYNVVTTELAQGNFVTMDAKGQIRVTSPTGHTFTLVAEGGGQDTMVGKNDPVRREVLRGMQTDLKLLSADDPKRMQIAQQVLLMESADGKALAADGKTEIDLTNPNSPHAKGLKEVHKIGLDGPDGEKKARGDAPFTKLELVQKLRGLYDLGFTELQADALMRAGVAGLEANPMREVTSGVKFTQMDSLGKMQEYEIRGINDNGSATVRLPNGTEQQMSLTTLVRRAPQFEIQVLLEKGTAIKWGGLDYEFEGMENGYVLARSTRSNMVRQIDNFEVFVKENPGVKFIFVERVRASRPSPSPKPEPDVSERKKNRPMAPEDVFSAQDVAINVGGTLETGWKVTRAKSENSPEGYLYTFKHADGREMKATLVQVAKWTNEYRTKGADTPVPTPKPKPEIANTPSKAGEPIKAIGIEILERLQPGATLELANGRVFTVKDVDMDSSIITLEDGKSTFSYHYGEAPNGGKFLMSPRAGGSNYEITKITKAKRASPEKAKQEASPVNEIMDEKSLSAGTTVKLKTAELGEIECHIGSKGQLLHFKPTGREGESSIDTYRLERTDGKLYAVDTKGRKQEVQSLKPTEVPAEKVSYTPETTTKKDSYAVEIPGIQDGKILMIRGKGIGMLFDAEGNGHRQVAVLRGSDGKLYVQVNAEGKFHEVTSIETKWGDIPAPIDVRNAKAGDHLIVNMHGMGPDTTVVFKGLNSKGYPLCEFMNGTQKMEVIMQKSEGGSLSFVDKSGNRYGIESVQKPYKPYKNFEFGDRVCVLHESTDSQGRKTRVLQEDWIVIHKNGEFWVMSEKLGMQKRLNPKEVVHARDAAKGNLPDGLIDVPNARMIEARRQHLEKNATLNPNLYKAWFPEHKGFSQANVGNCYLLATFHSLRHSPHFETLIRTSITPKMMGEQIIGYYVKIPLGSRNATVVELSINDVFQSQQTTVHSYDPVKAPIGWMVLEAAYTKHVFGVDEIGLPNRKASEGGYGAEVMTKLLGMGMKSDLTIRPETLHLPLSDVHDVQYKNATEAFLNNFFPENIIATANTPRRPKGDKEKFTAKDVDGRDWEMSYTHAYSIESVDRIRKVVTVVNPHDTHNMRITFTYEQFMKTFSDISAVEIDCHQMFNQ